VVEQSLWAAVPSFLRRLSAALKKHTGRELPLNATPIKFGSWMGGDRDGNPNVTAKTTHHVVALSRCAQASWGRTALHIIRSWCTLAGLLLSLWLLKQQHEAAISCSPSNAAGAAAGGSTAAGAGGWLLTCTCVRWTCCALR
jgi:phosphoenolpyruvate carboxylase